MQTFDRTRPHCTCRKFAQFQGPVNQSFFVLGPEKGNSSSLTLISTKASPFCLQKYTGHMGSSPSPTSKMTPHAKHLYVMIFISSLPVFPQLPLPHPTSFLTRCLFGKIFNDMFCGDYHFIFLVCNGKKPQSLVLSIPNFFDLIGTCDGISYEYRPHIADFVVPFCQGV